MEIYQKENAKLRESANLNKNREESLDNRCETLSEESKREEKKKGMFKGVYLFLVSKKSTNQFKSQEKSPYFQIKSHTGLCLYSFHEEKDKRPNYRQIEQHNFKEIFLNQKVNFD